MVEIPDDDTSDDVKELDPDHQPVKMPDESGDVEVVEEAEEVVEEEKAPGDKRKTSKRSNVIRSDSEEEKQTTKTNKRKWTELSEEDVVNLRLCLK